MSGPDSDSVSLNNFSPPDKITDPGTVLGTSSQIGTEVGQINWETYGQTLDNLVKYRDSINTKWLQDMATNWSTHGKKLSSLAGEFSNEVKSKIIDSWDSTGGAVASTAVQRYADQLLQLPVVMDAIASSLGFSAKFLDATKKNIPDQHGMLTDGTEVITHIDDSKKGYSDSGSDYAQNYTTWAPYSSQVQNLMKQELTQRANDVMNEIFVPNGKSVDGAMPKFPFPQSVTQGLPDPTGKVQPTGPGPGPGPGPSLKTTGLTPGLTGLGLTNGTQQQSDLAKQEAAYQAQQDAAAKQQQAQLQQQEQLAAQQQQQQAAQQAAQQGQQAVQQGLQTAQQAAQQGMQAAQQAMQQATQGNAQDAAKNLADGMGLAGLSSAALSGLGKGGLGGGLGGEINAAKGSLLASEEQASKLFPRAAMAAKAEETAVEEARAGMSSSGGMGPMGGMGAAGRGQQEKDKEKKRAEFLDSEEWLEKAMGDAPVTSKPVVDG